jgi:hypothetical protein
LAWCVYSFFGDGETRRRSQLEIAIGISKKMSSFKLGGISGTGFFLGMGGSAGVTGRLVRFFDPATFLVTSGFTGLSCLSGLEKGGSRGRWARVGKASYYVARRG